MTNGKIYDLLKGSGLGIVGPNLGPIPTYEGIKMQKNNFRSVVNVYAIHDKKAETYEQIFTLPNHAYAIRSFEEIVNRADTPYNKFAEDFELTHLGTYDQENGKLSSMPLPAVLCQASELKRETK